MAEDPSLPPGFNADGSPTAPNKGGKRKDGTDWSTPRVTIPDSEFRGTKSGRNAKAHARKDPNKTCGWKKVGRRPCRHWKGFRTDHPGKGRCYKHDQPSQHKHLLKQMAIEHWTANGGPQGLAGRKPVTPELAATYLLSMWSDYVHRLDLKLSEWEELSGNERQVLMSQLHVFSTDLSNLTTGLLRLGFRGPVLGEDMARMVLAIMEATLGRFQWGTEKAQDIDPEDIMLAFTDEWQIAERRAESETETLMGINAQGGFVEGNGHDVPDEQASSLPYEKWKRPELKSELEDRGLEVGGPRAVMAQRLREDDRSSA